MHTNNPPHPEDAAAVTQCSPQGAPCASDADCCGEEQCQLDYGGSGPSSCGPGYYGGGVTGDPVVSAFDGSTFFGRAARRPMFAMVLLTMSLVILCLSHYHVSVVVLFVSLYCAFIVPCALVALMCHTGCCCSLGVLCLTCYCVCPFLLHVACNCVPHSIGCIS